MIFPNLTNFDFTIMSIILISVCFAFARGFVKSFIYFMGWVISAIIVVEMHSPISEFISQYIKTRIIVDLISTIGFYILLLIIFSIFSSKLMNATNSIRGGAIDRSLGAAFGLARGYLISIALFWSLTMVFSALNDNEQPKWLKESKNYNLLKLSTKILIESFIKKDDKSEIINFFEENKKLFQDNVYKNFDINDTDKEEEDIIESSETNTETSIYDPDE